MGRRRHLPKRARCPSSSLAVSQSGKRLRQRWHRGGQVGFGAAQLWWRNRSPLAPQCAAAGHWRSPGSRLALLFCLTRGVAKCDPDLSPGLAATRTCTVVPRASDRRSASGQGRGRASDCGGFERLRRRSARSTRVSASRTDSRARRCSARAGFARGIRGSSARRAHLESAIHQQLLHRAGPGSAARSRLVVALLKRLDRCAACLVCEAEIP